MSTAAISRPEVLRDRVLASASGSTPEELKFAPLGKRHWFGKGTLNPGRKARRGLFVGRESPCIGFDYTIADR